METRQLGKNGPHVPVVCLGTWGLGGGFSPIPERQAVDTIRAAIDSGITFLDTAENYREGPAMIGKAINGQRDRLFLTSKVSGRDHSAQHIQDALDATLKALGTDHVDLYQLHSPQPQWPIQETMGHLIRQRDAGKLRYIGVSNFSPAQTSEAMRFGPVHSSQPRYSMLFRDEETASLPFCLKNGVGVMAFSPMAKGLLSGQYKPGHQFPPDDERHSWPFFQGEEFNRIYVFTEKLKGWAGDHGRDIAQLAIAWTLANPAVTTSIVGARTPEQARHNATAGGWKLSKTDLKEIDDLQGDLKLVFHRKPTA